MTEGEEVERGKERSKRRVKGREKAGEPGEGKTRGRRQRRQQERCQGTRVLRQVDLRTVPMQPDKSGLHIG